MSIIIHKDNLPVVDLDTSSFVYEGDYILIQDEYVTDILKCMNVPEITYYCFYLICNCGHFRDYPEFLEKYALKSAYNSYSYAHEALKGRFELGEKVIAKCSFNSYLYASYVLKGRFELGERAIMNSDYSIKYQSKFWLTFKKDKILRNIKHLWNRLFH